MVCLADQKLCNSIALLGEESLFCEPAVNALRIFFSYKFRGVVRFCPEAHLWSELGRFLSKGKGMQHTYLGKRRNAFSLLHVVKFSLVAVVQF